MEYIIEVEGLRKQYPEFALKALRFPADVLWG